MPKHSSPLDLAFHALADPSRRAIVDQLTRGPASVSELAAPLGMALPTVTQHLAVLERSGMVRSRKRGRTRVCRLGGGGMDLAERWITDRRLEAERRLDRLGDWLAATDPGPTAPEPARPEPTPPEPAAPPRRTDERTQP
ncbi:metalloregulator ArsR/SmtB family transcription factor [Isoptericola sp. b441]|uniref:Metalloregulator ArsR/SmtB family transcription factor n=1 Tax=Actinotalea lenta TaxID=3064654 RepID=A0ABT9D9I8_9CELL|nr:MULTISPECIES: metalloregulator ArsR/SmtB family transcription factor [unclassified Isoptericola]MDO8107570.1 metalloregulator ArsR/SmtB family transcription factor [Isoptericola sp. b441]MDO8120770.1 metalloregulator ArsR/SmtB family transcription factor [Isoptericola sp. b490]